MKNKIAPSCQRALITSLCFMILINLGYSQTTWYGDNRDFYVINNNRTSFSIPTGLRIHNGNDWWDFDFHSDERLIFNWNDNSNVIFYKDGDVYVRDYLQAHQVYGRDYVFGKNRIITDGNIELGANKVIKKRGSGSGHLSFTGFTEYRFDKPLSDPNSNLVLNDNVDLNFKLSFKPGTLRQMIDLWGTEYGIGIQSHTTYFRTHSNFAWYRGGTHSGSERNPGGGNVDMVLERGKLGIGLGNPTTKLDVNGTSRFRDFATFDAGADVTGTLKNQHIQINSDRISADGLAGTQDLLLTDNNGINLRSDNIIIENEDGTSTSDALTIRSTNTMLETNLYGENGTVTFKDAVFIESTNGLTVKETINTQDLNVTPGAAPGAPDYVFEKDYDLRSLEEVQKHIKKKGHLPEVPSAKQIEEEGYTMVEMDFTLLKKVEELTLYLLEMKSQNESLTLENKKLWESNQKLEESMKELKRDIKKLKKTNQ